MDLLNQQAGLIAAERFPSAYIHFGNGVRDKTGRVQPWLGLNVTNKTHRDPPGVYFYPCRWLLKGDFSFGQYGLAADYFWICDIRKRAGSGYVLGRMTAEQASGVARRNGWLDELARIRQDPSPLLALRGFDRRNIRNEGALFYSTADWLVNEQKSHTWPQLLRGLDWLEDQGRGIINPAEPNQLVALNTGVITVLEQGENKLQYDRFLGLAREIAAQYGAELKFQNKIPTFATRKDNRPFRVAFLFSEMRWQVSSYQQGVWHDEMFRLSGDQWSAALAIYRSEIPRSIEQQLRTADRDGVVLPWSKAKFAELLKKILIAPNSGDLRVSVSDGALVGSYIGRFGIYMILNASPDGLRVEYSREVNDSESFDFEIVLRDTDVDRAGEEFLQQSRREWNRFCDEIGRSRQQILADIEQDDDADAAEIQKEVERRYYAASGINFPEARRSRFRMEPSRA